MPLIIPTIVLNCLPLILPSLEIKYSYSILTSNRKNGPVAAARLYIGSEPSGSRCIRLLYI